MGYKILLTSTSFQDTPGAHHQLLKKQNFEIKMLRGPLKENDLIEVIDKFDGIICGDDEITKTVISKGASGKLKVISKYGIGMDKIDLVAAKEYGISVCNCPGVNKVTVAEHVFALLLAYIKNIIYENEITQNQKWIRLTGKELYDKTIGILGTGNIGKEVITRALAFGMKVIAFDKYPDKKFASRYNVKYYSSPIELIKKSDFISLNLTLDSQTRKIINNQSLSYMKKGIIIVNTARAGLVDNQAILDGIEKGIIAGYLTDVLEEEPLTSQHRFLGKKEIIITPHIGSRTHENVVKQGKMAVENLIKSILNE
ncbi:MAG: phosphoglycerate dehydrogenase [Flavobacteriaceae bacterium]